MLHLHQVLQPLARAIAIRVTGLFTALVLPVRGDAGFGHTMHFLGANLHLDRHAVRPEQRRVQRLIAVDPRNRDVVLEATRHRPIQAVHRPSAR